MPRWLAGLYTAHSILVEGRNCTGWVVASHKALWVHTNIWTCRCLLVRVCCAFGWGTPCCPVWYVTVFFRHVGLSFPPGRALLEQLGCSSHASVPRGERGCQCIVRALLSLHGRGSTHKHNQLAAIMAAPQHNMTHLSASLQSHLRLQSQLRSQLESLNDTAFNH